MFMLEKEIDEVEKGELLRMLGYNDTHDIQVDAEFARVAKELEILLTFKDTNLDNLDKEIGFIDECDLSKEKRL